MGNFERLQGQVEDGVLRMVHIEAVPRSVSTALARAINEFEGQSVYVNEPFNRYQRDVDVAAGHILAATDPITRTSDEPLTVVTKSTSRNLSPTNFRDWMSATDGVVWSVRDPLVQIGSLVTRYANDIFVEPEADVLKQHDLTPEHIAAANEFLLTGSANSATSANHPESRDYSKTSWADIGAHFRSGHQPDKSIVIDAEAFTDRPDEVLTRACGRLGLRYTDRMVDGWEGEVINANTGYNQGRDPSELAWTNHAVTSTGIVPVSREGLDLAQLPPTLQEHITQVAMPTYREMLAIGG